MNAPLSKEHMALLMSDSLTVRERVLPGNDDTRAEPRPSLFARVSALVSERLHHRSVISELRGLSDRELADIGLHRADLGRVFDPAFAASRM